MMISRDVKVLEGIERHKYIRSDQVAELYFQAIRNPAQRKMKANARLRKLYERKMCQRMRFPGEPYIYCVNGSRYSTKLQHYLAIVDVLISILYTIPDYIKVSYDVEKNIEDEVITDLYLTTQNSFTRETKDYYIEVQLNSSEDITEKLRKYEVLFDACEVSGTLVIVSPSQSTLDKVKRYHGAIRAVCINLNRVREEWKW